VPDATDPQTLGEALKATVGVVEHGLFIGLADEALLGKPDGQVEVMTRP
jgi:ribose 5-phosphate isomerase A